MSGIYVTYGCLLLLLGCLLLTTLQAIRLVLLSTGSLIAQPIIPGTQTNQYGSLPDRVQWMVKQALQRPVCFTLAPWV